MPLSACFYVSTWMPCSRFARALAASALLLAGCATVQPGPPPSEWQPWTDAIAGSPSVALRDLVIEVPAAAASAGEWTMRWITSPASTPWTDETLRLIVKYQHNPLRASRALTLVHVAMHDAVVLAARSGLPADAHAVAIHRAAGMVLGHLFTGEVPGRLEALGVSGAVGVARARAIRDEHFSTAFAAGSAAGEATIQRALRDGSGKVWPVRLRPRDRAGGWRAAPPLNMYDPAEAFAGEWRTWVLKDGAEIAPPPPVAYGSDAYWREAREVLEVSRALTGEQRRIADEWHLDAGSVTPAGVWNRKARELSLSHRLDDAAASRLFASLNVAMMDSLIACWNAKMRFWTQRPVNAIRERLDPAYLPHLYTPPFPSYVSGHAAVSGAAAEVLAAFFPSRAEEFARMAREAAESRLYGGIHFRSDNEAGLELGMRVGALVVKRVAPGAQRAPANTR